MKWQLNKVCGLFRVCSIGNVYVYYVKTLNINLRDKNVNYFICNYVCVC